MTARLDIVIPVYNEGRNILATLGALRDHMRTPARIMICYDRPDDDFNGAIVDTMVGKAEAGADIVCASRFMRGGCMVGCPWLKALLVRVAAFTLYYIARLPTHDPTSGFRLFSRRVIDSIAVESDSGFCYSIELLVKCHRLGWPVAEVPAQWFERTEGASRFRVISWLPAYLRWYGYALATTFLRLPANSVKLRSSWNSAT